MAQELPGFALAVLRSLRSGVVAVGVDGRIALMNAEARRLLHCPQGMPGRDCREVLAGEPTLAELLLEAAAGRGELARADLALEGGGPEGATIGLSLFPVLDAEGERCGAAMLFRDLAPIERSVDQERLQGRLAALGQMAAGLAHEIRNPLASMEVLAGLLRRRLGGDEEKGLIEDLITQLHDLNALVNTSLDYVRPSAPRRARLHPVTLVEGALARALPPTSPVTVERDFSAPLPRIAVDEGLLVTALANLVTNACVAMEEADSPHRRLRIGVAASEAKVATASVRLLRGTPPDDANAVRAEVTISVSDSGPGIPYALREKVFYPFFTTREGGSGIGLATVQKIVASHGGTIELESRPGCGATFRVHLPVDAPERESA